MMLKHIPPDGLGSRYDVACGVFSHDPTETDHDNSTGWWWRWWRWCRRANIRRRRSRVIDLIDGYKIFLSVFTPPPINASSRRARVSDIRRVEGESWGGSPAIRGSVINLVVVIVVRVIHCVYYNLYCDSAIRYAAQLIDDVWVMNATTATTLYIGRRNVCMVYNSTKLWYAVYAFLRLSKISSTRLAHARALDKHNMTTLRFRCAI